VPISNGMRLLNLTGLTLCPSWGRFLWARKTRRLGGWANVRNRPRGGQSALCHGALAGPTLVGLCCFRPCARVSCGHPHLLLFERRRSTEAAYSVKAAKTKAPINAATAIAIRARKNLIIPSNAATTILFNGIA
jgi:hypothetical protein